MDQIIREFRKLVEDDVGFVAGELGALVVDFLHVAFSSRRADDVGGIGDPLLQPFEALAAHPRRQHRHAAASQDAGDGNAAATVVAGGWPHRPIMPGVELSGDQARYQARIGGEHLVRADHGEAAAEEHDDRRLHPGQRLRQHHVPRHEHPLGARGVVEPVHAPQVPLVRLVGADRLEVAHHRRGDARGIGELAPARQGHARGAQRFDRGAPTLGIDHFRPHEREVGHFVDRRAAKRVSRARPRRVGKIA